MARDHLMGYTGHLRALYGPDAFSRPTVRTAPRPPENPEERRMRAASDALETSKLPYVVNTPEQPRMRGTMTTWRVSDGEIVDVQSGEHEVVDDVVNSSTRVLMRYQQAMLDSLGEEKFDRGVLYTLHGKPEGVVMHSGAKYFGDEYVKLLDLATLMAREMFTAMYRIDRDAAIDLIRRCLSRGKLKDSNVFEIEQYVRRVWTWWELEEDNEGELPALPIGYTMHAETRLTGPGVRYEDAPKVAAATEG